jgi:predicted ferric reductase
MRFKKLLAWFVIILLAIIPVLVLILGKKGNIPSDYGSITHLLGQITGLIGMTLFAITFILSTRLKFIEEGFGGLDKVYKAHCFLGGTALALILFHPLLLVTKFIPASINLAAKYLLPSSYWSVNFGIIALIGMIILLFITLYVKKIKYNNWKLTHKFLGIIFILAVLHIFLVRGSISQDNIFNGYFIYAGVVSLIGLSAFFYSLLFRNKVASGSSYIIKSVNKKSTGVYEIVMSPEYNPLKYKSGQFVFLTFKNKKIGDEPHPFSIASSSNNPSLKVVIKNLGDFTSKIDDLNIGDKVRVEGPYGRFNYERTGKDQIWIAGGIGITPFLGMAEDLEKNPNMRNKVELYYSVKCCDDFIELKKFKEVESKNKNFILIPWDTEEKGYIKAEDIFQISKDLRDKDFYICGPPSLKRSIIKGLLKEGVLKENIHMEDFDFR